MHVFATLLIVAVGLVVLGLAVAYVLVPLFRGLGWLIANLFKGLGWLIAHVFEFVGGILGDTLRLVGAVLTAIVLLPFAPLNVVVGRWSAAAHFAESIKRECKVAGSCLYRMLLRRPLKLVWLHGILEGVEQRLPEAMAAAPTRDKPRRRTGQFDGYNIVGSLPGGGSGAKLYIAEPLPEKTRKVPAMPSRVVIKAFALTEGSSLPQIVRESRALESAKQLGLVLDHAMDDHRFYYVMPYHAGDHLGIVTRQLHGQASAGGLDRRGLSTVLGYTADLLRTLSIYHRGGLWHKDVKPDNVIVHDGRANLVDLGLITPLRSAMTLTTHGTEYFRDPEMVRQALRGVKVHQVDGAKFDVYAVGAALYFMTENTFPAHGGLSRFGKQSPEALRWIIRRAMADYNKRYETADEMLSDIQVMFAAADPYQVRPVDLPSMTGRPAPAMEPPAYVARAATPVPPPMAGVQVPPPSMTPEPDSVLPEPVAPAAAAFAAGSGSGRPKLRVTNWWTGEYVVDHDGGVAAAAPAVAAHREMRQHSREARDHARGLREQVRRGTLTARQAAKEQIKSARSRAKELRRRAREHRAQSTSRIRAAAEKQPTPFLGFLVLAFLLVVGLVGFGMFKASQSRWNGNGWSSGVNNVPTPPTAPETWERPPMMLALDGDAVLSNEGIREIGLIVDKFNGEGYNVVLADNDQLNETMVMLLDEWTDESRRGVKEGPADSALEEIMEMERLYAVLPITVEERGDYVHIDVDKPVFSTRPGAKERRRVPLLDEPDPARLAGLPLVLLNDHPAKTDPAVAARIQEVVVQYEMQNYEVVTDDDVEAAIRKVLPPGPYDVGSPSSSRLNRMLNELGYGGVIRIDAASGDESSDRITVTRINAKPVADPEGVSAP